MGYENLALHYLEKFPIGSKEYAPTKFDSWAWKIPIEYRLDDLRILDKRCEWGPGHPGWGTHLQNRHRLKDRINKGGRSPELFDEDRFQITVDWNKDEWNGTRWKTIALFNEAINRSKTLAERNKNYLKSRIGYVTLLLTLAEDGEMGTYEKELLERCRDEVMYQEPVLIAAAGTIDRRVLDAVAKVKAKVLADRAAGKEISPRLCEALVITGKRRT